MLIFLQFASLLSRMPCLTAPEADALESFLELLGANFPGRENRASFLELARELRTNHALRKFSGWVRLLFRLPTRAPEALSGCTEALITGILRYHGSPKAVRRVQPFVSAGFVVLVVGSGSRFDWGLLANRRARDDVSGTMPVGAVSSL